MAKVAPDGLETFLAVVQAGSFSGAARRQNLTQSTVSTRIRELEMALDRTLFHRTTRQVRLTPDGRRLVGHARRVLAELQALSTDLGPDRPLTGVIRLGLPELMAVHWLPDFAARVGRAHPGLTLEYEVGLNPVLLNGMYRGDLDLVIFAGTGADAAMFGGHGRGTAPVVPPPNAPSPPGGRLVERLLCTLPAHWMAGRGFPLPARPLDPAALRRHPIIAQGRESYMTAVIRHWLGPAGAEALSPDSGTSCTSLMALGAMVQAGLGLALMPTAPFAHALDRGDLQIVPTDPPGWDIPFSLLHPENPTDPALAAVMGEVGGL